MASRSSETPAFPRNSPLPLSFYLEEDVVGLSRSLIGKALFTRVHDQVTGGLIVETEAYRGPEDRASHAFNNRRTPRNEVMYHQGGVAYVYLCYGIHSLLNVVSNQEGIPHDILIRAIEPLVGIDLMMTRRGKSRVDRTLTGGPGALSQALGISTELNGVSLAGPQVWIEETEYTPLPLIASPRVGVGYAQEDALLPWRFRVKDHPFTSAAR